MSPNSTAEIDDAGTSFLAFARCLLQKLGEWEKEAGPPRYEDIEVRFVEEGRTSDIVRKLDYERFFRRRWDSSLVEVKEFARHCVRLHLDRGLIKAPPVTDPEGRPIASPPFEDILPSLVWAVARPVLVTVDKLQTLDVSDVDLVDTYRRFAEGWSMADVPQVATIPLHNFTAAASLTITPYFELAHFTAADKNLLFSRTAIFSGHREPDHHSRFKLSGRFSNNTTRPVHFGTIFYESRLAIMAMRLLKSGDVGARMMYYRSSLEHEEFTGGSGMHFHVREFTQNAYTLQADEAASLLSLIALLRGAPRSLDVGLGRFNQSYSRQSGEDRVIDLTIALEGSLLADINQELRYRLALRGATLLRNERKPQEAYALLLALYDARSAIVHEGKLLHELDKKLKPLAAHFSGFQPQNLPSLSEDVTRQLLKAYLTRLASGETLGSVNARLDSELVENLDFGIGPET